MNEKVSRNAEEIIRHENERLKFRLGSKRRGLHSLIALPAENVLLKRILRAQQLDARPERISVRAYLGFPRVTPPGKLNAQQLYHELDRILTILKRNGILLSVCDDVYAPEELYRFIVEELFFEEIDDVHVKGLIHTFVYEDYHPNHDFDLRRQADEFLDSILSRSWSTDQAFHLFSDTVHVGGTAYGYNGVNTLILNFQRRHQCIHLDAFVIHHVAIDADQENGCVEATVRYTTSSGPEYRVVEGDCRIAFGYEFGCWFITRFEVAGFSDPPGSD